MSLASNNSAPITPKTQIVRTLLLPGGAYNGVMQMGVIHALMASRCKPPDVVAGISAGAIGAAALAEVLQARSSDSDLNRKVLEESDATINILNWTGASGDLIDSETARYKKALADYERTAEAAQIWRFRSLFQSWLRAPAELSSALFPANSGEMVNSEPREALQSPIFPEDERKDRQAGLSTRRGMVELLHTLYSLRLPVSEVATAAKSWLGLRDPSYLTNLIGILGLLWVLFRNVWAIAELLSNFGIAALSKGILQFQFVRRFKNFVPRVSTNAKELVRFCLTIIVGLSPIYVAIKLINSLGILPKYLHFSKVWGGISYAATVVFVFELLIIGMFFRYRKQILDAFLWTYDITYDLGNPYPLKQQLIQIFDKDYYGRQDVDKLTAEAFEKEHESDEDDPRPAAPADCADVHPKRTVLQYWENKEAPILVLPLAACLAADGRGLVPIHSLQGGKIKPPLVDALMAACALQPLFRSVTLGDNKCYIDGKNVTGEPFPEIFGFLKENYGVLNFAPNSRVLMYPVSNLPIERNCLASPKDQTYASPVDIGLRAISLLEFGDYQMERQLSGLYARVLPTHKAAHRMINSGKIYLSSINYPIEPHRDRAIEVNKKVILAKTPAERDEELYKAAADGCRMTLQAIHAPEIKQLNELIEQLPQSLKAYRTDNAILRAQIRTAHPDLPFPTVAGIAHEIEFRNNAGKDSTEVGVHCATLIKMRRDGSTLCGEAGEPPYYPGLPEICKRCAFFAPATPSNVPLKAADIPPARLALLELHATSIPWPRRKYIGQTQEWLKPEVNSEDTFATWKHQAKKKDKADEKTPDDTAVVLKELEGWPRNRQLPVKAFALNGGVFKGVFQVGAINALNQLRLTPDLIAGASIGGIVSGMVGNIFGTFGGDAQNRYELRCHHLSRLASTWIAIDKLVITDRFAEFVGRLDENALATEMSPNDIDRVFRTYDKDLFGFERRKRVVEGGFQRLFSLYPSEIHNLNHSLRGGYLSDSVKQFFECVRKWWARAGIQLEVLGTEPLRTLIEGHVLPPDLEMKDNPKLSCFNKHGIRLMLTACNLKDGCVDVWGVHRKLSGSARSGLPDDRDGLLIDAMLTGSAYPLAFRPRKLAETFPNVTEGGDELYIDGGTMDNLPLEPATRFLSNCVKYKVIHARPKNKYGEGTPHLMLNISLEPEMADVPPLENWMDIRAVASKLASNRKVLVYSQAQCDFREIADDNAQRFGPGNKRLAENDRPVINDPLDIKVVTVKPKWLVGLFEFHSYLGFKRKRQAASIAHGCASTILAMLAPAVHKLVKNGTTIDARYNPDSPPLRDWLTAWGVTATLRPNVVSPEGPTPDPHINANLNEDSGRCCFQANAICPFSRKGLKLSTAAAEEEEILYAGQKKQNSTEEEKSSSKWFTDDKIAELEQIYLACQKIETHRAPGPK